jgi:hypothetical protein
MIDNIYNFTKPRFIELSDILCSNCVFKKDCFDCTEMDDCDTYMIAQNSMKTEENK